MTSESITITNNSDKPLVLTTVTDDLVEKNCLERKLTISPKEGYVIFTNRLKSIHWDKY